MSGGIVERSRRVGQVAAVEWAPLTVLVLGGLVAGFGWRWTTRPMGDSASYRSAAATIFGGWHHLTDRTPGYPLLLWLTGSIHTETHLLFVAQLALHLGAASLVVRVASRLRVPVVGRVAIALLLVAPPEMILVVHSGSEALAQLLVAAVVWSFARWYDGRALRQLVVAGVALGVLAWVTPALALLALPVGVVVALASRGRGRVRMSVAAVVGPALLLAASLLVVNLVRFDAAELTPLTGWYLGSRTSQYVERLPARYEPARSILIAERNRELLEGDRVDAPNYSFVVRGRVGRALGLTRRQTDEYVLHMNVYLIAHHPLEYVDAVRAAVPRYLDIDAEPGVDVGGRVSGWLLALGHDLLAGVFALVTAVTAGLVWSRQVRGRTAALWSLGVLVAGYGLVAATALETGAARLRLPVDPVLVLLLVLGLGAARTAWRGGAAVDPATAPAT